MKRKKAEVDVVMPHLVEGKVWYIEYECFYAKTNKLEKFREYKGFAKCKTDEEKLRLSAKKIKSISKKLTSGWRPWDPTQYLYKDEIQYTFETINFGDKKNNSSHIRKYLSDFLNETKRSVAFPTYKSYQSKTRLFCKWLENNGHAKIRIFEISNAITKKFFDYLIDTKKLDRPTIEKYLQNLTKMFKYFQKHKLIDKIPLENIVKPPKTKDCAARPIMDDDLKKLFIHIAKNDEPFLFACLMQFFLCCRPGNELRLLKIQDIDTFNQLVHINEESGKTGKRKITMPEALIEVCNKFNIYQHPRECYLFSKDCKPGLKPLGKNYFSRTFLKYRKELNLPSFYKFYSIKHTGAGKLLESGATIVEVMSHLGHTDIESTLHYIKRHFGERSKKILDFRPDVLNSILK
jgi:integrase